MSKDWKRLGDVATDMGMADMRSRGTNDQGGVMTKHGWLSWAAIEDAGGRFVQDAHGHRVLHFPTWTKEGGRHFRQIPEHKLTEGDRQP